MNRTCAVCGIEKPIEEFVKNKRKKYGYGYECKECHRKRCNEYYKNNKSVIRKNADNYRRKIKEYINSLKEKGCILCGEKDIACLDFHHIGEKNFGIAQKIGTLSQEKLEKEIDKCVVLCSNCHRKVHYYGIQITP